MIDTTRPKPGHVVALPSLPACDICKEFTPARWDGPTVMGAWAYMCQKHAKMYHVGKGEQTGVGIGQYLIEEAEVVRGAD